MAISSRVRRVQLSCPESGGGFKANALAPQFAARRRSETKPDETKAKSALSFRPPRRFVGRVRRNRRFRDSVQIQIVTLRFVSPRDASPTALAAGSLLRFATIVAAVPLVAKQLSVETAGKRPSRAKPAAGRGRR